MNANRNSSKIELGKVSFGKKEFIKSTSQRIKSTKKNGLIAPSNNSNNRPNEEILEAIYNKLGHEVYTKLLSVFEKYCLYGKGNSNFSMDYSQFTTFMTQNNMYDSNLNKQNTELTFNKIKSHNKGYNYYIIYLISFSYLLRGFFENIRRILKNRVFMGERQLQVF